MPFSDSGAGVEVVGPNPINLPAVDVGSNGALGVSLSGGNGYDASKKNVEIHTTTHHMIGFSNLGCLSCSICSNRQHRDIGLQCMEFSPACKKFSH